MRVNQFMIVVPGALPSGQPPSGPIKLWTKGGITFTGNIVTWDLTTQLVVLGQPDQGGAAVDPITIDLNEIAAYQSIPPTVQTQPAS